MMTLDDIRQILDLVRQHELAEFELEQEGVKLRLRKSAPPTMTALVTPPLASTIVTPATTLVPVPAGVAAAAAPAAAAPVDEFDGDELELVKAPMVGTFYRSPDPTAEPFVDVGSMVKKGTVLCIIEAMKLMNEIESEHDGEIVKVFVDNGQPVQYGERLFAIKRR